MKGYGKMPKQGPKHKMPDGSMMEGATHPKSAAKPKPKRKGK